MNLEKINLALRILDLWYRSYEQWKADKRIPWRKAAMRWRVIGIINHDRILTGRPVISSFSKFR